MKKDNESRFGLISGVLLIIWILITNAVLFAIGFQYTWVVFISNIMMFTMAGDLKTRFLSVEIGGMVGLILTVCMLLVAQAITPAVGPLMGFIIPLCVILILLILVHPYAPVVFNNVGFAYLVCATINIPAFAENIPQHLIGFVIGSLVFNGVSILLLKLVQKLMAKGKPEDGSGAVAEKASDN